MSEARTRHEGVIRERLPNAMYQVELADGRRLRGHVVGEARVSLGRLIGGDAVLLEISPYDTGSCHIVGRVPGTRGR